jgi:hypothetical protein
MARITSAKGDLVKAREIIAHADAVHMPRLLELIKGEDVPSRELIQRFLTPQTKGLSPA